MRIFVIVTGLLLCIGIAVFVFLPGKNADKFTDIIDLQSPVSKSHLYIKKKIWGMTGEDLLILISNSRAKTYSMDLQTEMAYYRVKPFLYKFEADTLSVYTLKTVPVPPGFYSDIKVVQHVMDSVALHALLEHGGYKKLGMQVVSE
ncbi:hypothetical protein [Chitinophaga sp. Cy-1792]|uniref:hypothetical protein n=1 Tax=Chitinophaga sp. Cy-1792 TaxID=2608339 RepID=UPI0014241108|nr:hypothetical protein [Chitinophaga sp. Cy-1792]NIG56503.1 hypothetical protein [Chitinophaga sp. Cy-1792]